MDKRRSVFIYTNKQPGSLNVAQVLREKLLAAGIEPVGERKEDTDLIVTIGGDGALLKLIHEYDFPQNPVVGINTGHLGFFQDLLPESLDTFIEAWLAGRTSYQTLSTIESQLWTNDGMKTVKGLNEIVVRGRNGDSIYMNMSIEGSFIERFAGDGILVSTPAGSTAYNYSLGGSIVDPRLDLLQVTPIAPMNSSIYRSFQSSLILPSDLNLFLTFDQGTAPYVNLQTDGQVFDFHDVFRIRIGYSKTKLTLMHIFDEDDFWKKVKEKFLDA